MENSIEYNEYFKNAIEYYFGRKKPTDQAMVTAELEGEYFQSLHDPKSFILTFLIESQTCSGRNNVNLNDYVKFNHDNKKAKLLWASLKEKLEAKNPGIKFILKSWGKGSIIIGVAITKASNEEWNKEEIIKIEEKMKRFAEEFELTRDLSKCTMTIKTERRDFEKKLQTSQNLIYRLSTISKEMARQLDNVDTEKLKAWLQDEISKANNKTVVVSGMT